MNNYFLQWNVKRILQLLVGLFFIGYYFVDTSIIALIFGVLMSMQALLNIGCFSTRGCSSPTDVTENTTSFSKDIKEVEIKK